MNNNFNGNEESYQNVVNNNVTVDSTIVGETVSDTKTKRRIPGFIKVPISAIAFGVIASLSFQAVESAMPAKQTTVSGSNTNLTISKSDDSISSTSGIKKINTGNSASTKTDVSEVTENVMPSIVAIDCTQTVTQQDIFGRKYNQQAQGSGSGIIIGQNDKEVLIATNNHVVNDATVVQITFNDESTAKAEVKGTDSGADLAVVSVKLDSLKSETKKAIRVATLGDSDAVKVGEMSIAIGNALGYGQSVTVGYISAKNREVATEDYTMKLLQTDAAINPGNSGGALLDSQGRVIGINSVKYTSDEVEGMGYAIPISYAIPIINDLMNKEDIPEKEQAFLGISGLDVTSTISQQYDMPEGVYVDDVSNDYPASKAGIVKNDVIVKFNNRDVKTMTQLHELLDNKKASDKVEVVVKRLLDGEYKEKTFTVTLGAKSESANAKSDQETMDPNQDNGQQD